MKSSFNHQKNFKKKNSNILIDTQKQKQVPASDRFNDLKSKLQKQREIMKKTGRRFKDDNSVNIQTSDVRSQNKNKKMNQQINESKSCQIMVGPDQPISSAFQPKQKDKINLSEIQIDDAVSECSMKSSRVFQQEIQNHKKRTDQLLNFLTKIELQSFLDGLVTAGFDDLQSLSGITNQDLNHLMMRGRQQDKLFFSLKHNNIIEDDAKLQNNSSRPSTSATQWRLKTESSSLHSSRTDTSSRMKTQSTLQLVKQAKQTSYVEKPNNFMGSSFIYMVGSKNWSLEDQVRKACSNCFRVHPQMQQKGDCYYCETCFKALSNDILNVSLDQKMGRSYTKF